MECRLLEAQFVRPCLGEARDKLVAEFVICVGSNVT